MKFASSGKKYAFAIGEESAKSNAGGSSGASVQ